MKEKIDGGSMLEVVRSSPKQFQLVLYSILLLKSQNNKGAYSIVTGEVYEAYKESSKKLGLKILSTGRVSEIITELGMLGLIQIKVVSKGRYGRTKEIDINLPETTIKEITLLLKQILNLRRKK